MFTVMVVSPVWDSHILIKSAGWVGRKVKLATLLYPKSVAIYIHALIGAFMTWFIGT
jgi:hypothetical protein